MNSPIKISSYHIFFLSILLAHLGLLFHQIPRSKKLPLYRPIKLSLISRDHTKKQIVSSESPITEKKIKATRESDKNRVNERETQARKKNAFRSGKSLSLSELGAFPKGFNPLKARRRKSFEKVSATNDYLKDIKVSEHTLINTMENKYFGFYQRIKAKLEGYWHRNIREEERSLNNNGRIVSDDMYTVIKIILSAEGELLNVVLVSSCGIQEFDQAAIESIKEAAPFQNPPKGLIKNGRVFLDWGFLVKT